MTIARSMTFPKELYKQLEQTAKDYNISVASLIKMACSEYLNHQSQEYKFAMRDILLSSPVTAPSADKLFPIYKHKGQL
jgi:predicted DNA-binding ribbon-helix-helix protein